VGGGREDIGDEFTGSWKGRFVQVFGENFEGVQLCKCGAIRGNSGDY
jgi:hypothetical protein